MGVPTSNHVHTQAILPLELPQGPRWRPSQLHGLSVRVGVGHAHYETPAATGTRSRAVATRVEEVNPDLGRDLMNGRLLASGNLFRLRDLFRRYRPQTTLRGFSLTAGDASKVIVYSNVQAVNEKKPKK